MNNNNKLGLRRGPVDHSFNLPYSLELIFDFLGKSCFLRKVTLKQQKKPGRDAAHRSPEWGCTKTKASLSSQNFWLLDFGDWLSRGLTTRKSSTASPIS